MQTLPENTFSPHLPLKLLDKSMAEHILKLKDQKGKSVVEIKYSARNTFQFKVKNHIGYFSIAGVTYFISSKFGTRGLENLLDLASNIKQRLTPAKACLKEGGETFDEYLAYLFLGLFHSSIKTKLKFNYNQETKKDYQSSGSLNIQKSLLFLSYSAPAPTWSYSNLTRNTILNQTIKTVLAFLGRHLKVSRKTKSLLLKEANEMPCSLLTELPNIDQLIKALDRDSFHYEPFLVISKLITKKSSLTAKGSETYTILMSSWKIFETAVQNATKFLLEKHSMGIKLENKKVYTLTTKTNWLDPDLLFMKKAQGTPFFVGDCKYTQNEKVKVIRDHLFQVNAYMDGFLCRNGFLVYPGTSFRLKQYKTSWNYNVWILTVDINDRNAFLDGLSQFICKVLDSEDASFYKT